ncbi:MAG: SDR family NAD(P)-dependent oxidoreductase, partial [Alphaproteobacteria bacterium]
MSETKCVILTGASRGIGHATVKRFSEAGWRVITCSREDVPAECLVGNARHQHIVADLGDTASVEAFVAEAHALLGDAALHGLVNNAGVSPKSEIKERLGCLNADLDHWRTVFELNFFAPLMLARGFAAALHRGRGAVVNVTSIAGHRV